MGSMLRVRRDGGTRVEFGKLQNLKGGLEMNFKGCWEERATGLGEEARFSYQGNHRGKCFKEGLVILHLREPT